MWVEEIFAVRLYERGKTYRSWGWGRRGKQIRPRTQKRWKLCLTYYSVPPTMNTEYCRILEWGLRRDYNLQDRWRAPGTRRNSWLLLLALIWGGMIINKERILLRTWTWGRESYFGSVDPSLRNFIGSDSLRRLYMGLRVWYKLP